MAYGKVKRRSVARLRSKRSKRTARRKLVGGVGGSQSSQSSDVVRFSPQRVARAAGYQGMYNTVGKLVRAASGYGSGRRGMKCPRGYPQPDDEGTGAYSQWTQAYKQAKFGRLTPRKIDKLSTERIIYTHRRIGPFNDYGQQYMLNYQDANGDLNYPLMLFELNSCNNIVNGAITTQNPVYRMGQYSLTTNVAWFPVSGQEADGVTTNNAWRLESASHSTTSTGAYPLEQAIHKWSSLDLELWGCRNKPTKYHISLVQFSEDVLPSYGNATSAATEFWQSLIKQYTYSPLAKMEDGYNRNKMKILKQYKVNIDPTANFENDPDPHVRTMKLFYKFNRMSNFSWEYSNPIGMTIAEMGDADWKSKSNQNKTQVHPNARIYVMVRASNYTKITSPNVVDNTTTPSISWRMRTCWMANN